MLKKAGILVGIAAAGVLALTPLAFANNDSKEDAPAVSSMTSIEDNNLTNDCPITQEGPEVDSTATGGDSFLGAAGLVTDIIAPVTTQTQLGNCVNLGVNDVIDSNSGNTDESFTRTEVEDSFNTDVDG